MSACDGCAHFGRRMESGRLYCVDVIRYIPNKIRTWTFRDVPLEYTDEYGHHVNCSDFEPGKKKAK